MGCLCPSLCKKRKGIIEGLISKDIDYVKQTEEDNNNFNSFQGNKIDYENIKIDAKKDNKINKDKYKGIFLDEDFAKLALAKNNEYRSFHGVKPLELDQYLCLRAFLIAKPSLLGEEVDNENLFYENGEDLGVVEFQSEKKLKPESLMEKWYGEIKDYNFKEPNEVDCTSFTQMIWKGSKKFGIAYYSQNQENEIKVTDSKEEEDEENNKKEHYYVALYYPAGNKPGEFKENVPPKAKEKDDSKEIIMHDEGSDDRNEP